MCIYYITLTCMYMCIYFFLFEEVARAKFSLSCYTCGIFSFYHHILIFVYVYLSKFFKI